VFSVFVSVVFGVSVVCVWCFRGLFLVFVVFVSNGSDVLVFVSGVFGVSGVCFFCF